MILPAAATTATSVRADDRTCKTVTLVADTILAPLIAHEAIELQDKLALVLVAATLPHNWQLPATERERFKMMEMGR